MLIAQRARAGELVRVRITNAQRATLEGEFKMATLLSRIFGKKSSRTSAGHAQ